ncbi:hypothetical protein XHC_3425 [Xanthomonas hortorum pv. carotae str. M081]|nr:hypothetical protein XHC_3425 [Xanthomonas hortorum pv. carotae str. M081]
MRSWTGLRRLARSRGSAAGRCEDTPGKAPGLRCVIASMMLALR